MKKCLIHRLGAFGDSIIITPVLRELKKQGYYIILNTSERGKHILKNNPNIDEYILEKTDSVPNDKLDEHWKKMRKRIKPDKVINFSESLEVDIVMHPASPRYNLSKKEREKYTLINYYEHTFKHAKIEIPETVYAKDFFKPEMFFTEEEEKKAQEILKKDKFNIIWGLSGSGKNKCYPWFDYICNNILSKNKNVHIYFVGDEQCQILEYGWEKNPNVTCLSGKIKMRESIALTKYADLVVCPDTGLIHGAGCFDTPKICLLGHTTIENITKHFVNDYSIEADPELAECAPCARLIYEQSQCPLEPLSNAVWCMHHGISMDKVENKILEVICQSKKNK